MAKPQVVADGVDGEVEGGGSFLCGHASEEPHFEKPGHVGITRRDPVQGTVDVENRLEIEVPGRLLNGAWLGERQRPPASTLFGCAGAGVVHQDAAHRAGGEGVELGAGANIGRQVGAEAEKYLVHEGGGLECVGGALTPHLAGCQPVQVLVDQGHEARKRFRASPSQFRQVFRDRARAGVTHGTHYPSGPVRPRARPGMMLPNRRNRRIALVELCGNSRMKVVSAGVTVSMRILPNNTFRAAALSLAVCASLALSAEVPTEGSKAPGFTLQSQEGKTVNLNDFKGQWVVLYFYPKDMTQGCTIEAHNFQRDQDQYNAKHAAIVGVSADSVDSHVQFCTKENLTFKLLADPGKEMIGSYGSLAANGAVAARNTFLIDPQGVIRKVYTAVKPNPHSEEVLAALAELQKK